MPVPLAEPGAVVPVLEREEDVAQLLDGPERTHPEQLLLGGPSRPPVRCPTKLQGGREIPNLRQRANAYLGYLAERYLQPIETSVTVVDRDADAASGTFEVRLELPNPEHRVTAGLKRKVNFPGAPQR